MTNTVDGTPSPEEMAIIQERLIAEDDEQAESIGMGEEDKGNPYEVPESDDTPYDTMLEEEDVRYGDRRASIESQDHEYEAELMDTMNEKAAVREGNRRYANAEVKAAQSNPETGGDKAFYQPVVDVLEAIGESEVGNAIFNVAAGYGSVRAASTVRLAGNLIVKPLQAIGGLLGLKDRGAEQEKMVKEYETWMDMYESSFQGTTPQEASYHTMLEAYDVGVSMGVIDASASKFYGEDGESIDPTGIVYTKDLHKRENERWVDKLYASGKLGGKVASTLEAEGNRMLKEALPPSVAAVAAFAAEFASVNKYLSKAGSLIALAGKGGKIGEIAMSAVVFDFITDRGGQNMIGAALEMSGYKDAVISNHEWLKYLTGEAEPESLVMQYLSRVGSMTVDVAGTAAVFSLAKKLGVLAKSVYKPAVQSALDSGEVTPKAYKNHIKDAVRADGLSAEKAEEIAEKVYKDVMTDTQIKPKAVKKAMTKPDGRVDVKKHTETREKSSTPTNEAVLKVISKGDLVDVNTTLNRYPSDDLSLQLMDELGLKYRRVNPNIVELTKKGREALAAGLSSEDAIVRSEFQALAKRAASGDFEDRKYVTMASNLVDVLATKPIQEFRKSNPEAYSRFYDHINDFVNSQNRLTSATKYTNEQAVNALMGEVRRSVDYANWFRGADVAIKNEFKLADLVRAMGNPNLNRAEKNALRKAKNALVKQMPKDSVERVVAEAFPAEDLEGKARYTMQDLRKRIARGGGWEDPVEGLAEKAVAEALKVTECKDKLRNVVSKGLLENLVDVMVDNVLTGVLGNHINIIRALTENYANFTVNQLQQLPADLYVRTKKALNIPYSVKDYHIAVQNSKMRGEMYKLHKYIEIYGKGLMKRGRVRADDATTHMNLNMKSPNASWEGEFNKNLLDLGMDAKKDVLAVAAKQTFWQTAVDVTRMPSKSYSAADLSGNTALFRGHLEGLLEYGTLTSADREVIIKLLEGDVSDMAHLLTNREVKDVMMKYKKTGKKDTFADSIDRIVDKAFDSGYTGVHQDALRFLTTEQNLPSLIHFIDTSNQVTYGISSYAARITSELIGSSKPLKMLMIGGTTKVQSTFQHMYGETAEPVMDAIYLLSGNKHIVARKAERAGRSTEGYAITQASKIAIAVGMWKGVKMLRESGVLISARDMAARRNFTNIHPSGSVNFFGKILLPANWFGGALEMAMASVDTLQSMEELYHYDNEASNDMIAMSAGWLDVMASLPSDVLRSVVELTGVLHNGEITDALSYVSGKFALNAAGAGSITKAVNSVREYQASNPTISGMANAMIFRKQREEFDEWAKKTIPFFGGYTETTVLSNGSKIHIPADAKLDQFFTPLKRDVTDRIASAAGVVLGNFSPIKLDKIEQEISDVMAKGTVGERQHLIRRMAYDIGYRRPTPRSVTEAGRHLNKRGQEILYAQAGSLSQEDRTHRAIMAGFRDVYSKLRVVAGLYGYKDKSGEGSIERFKNENPKSYSDEVGKLLSGSDRSTEIRALDDLFAKIDKSALTIVTTPAYGLLSEEHYKPVNKGVKLSMSSSLRPHS